MIVVVSDIMGGPPPEVCLSTLAAGMAGQSRPVLRLSLGALSGRPDLSGEDLHHHLVACRGFDTAAVALVAMGGATRIGLGYSAGGTALWKAVERGMGLGGLICLSSTRLREVGPISVETHVIFGARDPGCPDGDWLRRVPAGYRVLPGAGHSFYADPTSASARQAAQDVARMILSRQSPQGQAGTDLIP